MEKLRQHFKRFLDRLNRHISRQPQLFTYVALGDSTVEGIGASHPTRTYAHLIYNDLNSTFKHVRYHNLGKSGARIHDVVEHQLRPGVIQDPDLITISIGANDVLHRTRLKAFRGDLETLLATLKDKTRAMVVMTNIPNFSVTPAVPSKLKTVAQFRIRQYNKVIEKVAAAHNVTLVDTFRQSTLIAQQFPEAVSKDNFHPSDFGYALWANTIVTAIHDRLMLLRVRKLTHI